MSTLEKIQWFDGLSIGNANVDQDHKKLIKIYNDLVDLVTFQKSRESFAIILSQMTDYSLLHFRKEEEYMKAFSYPGLKGHRQHHMDYIYKVSMFNLELSRFNTTDPNDVILFLEKWWVNHILEKDIAFEKYKVAINSNACYNEF
jgi:hemerythrin